MTDQTTQETTPKYHLGRICSPVHTWAGRNAMVCNCGAWHINDEGEIAPNIASPEERRCPRAKSDMTPCVEKDGALAQAEGGCCVGCGESFPTPTVEGSVRKRIEALPRYDANGDEYDEGDWIQRSEVLALIAPSPTAARGVTGLPSAVDVQEALSRWADRYRSAITAEFNAGEDYAETDPDVDRAFEASRKASDAVLALVTALLSAAEQGERDREDAERFRGLEQFVVGITTRCSDGYEEDYERDDLPDEDGEEFREWIDFMLKNSRANEADAARQPRQEGDR